MAREIALIVEVHHDEKTPEASDSEIGTHIDEEFMPPIGQALYIETDDGEAVYTVTSTRVSG